MRATAVGALLVAAAILVAACTSPQATRPVAGPLTPTVHLNSRTLGLVSASPALTDRLVLGSTRISSGTVIKGTLVVTNHSPRPVNLTTTCRPSWAIGLAGQHATQRPAFTTACPSEPLMVKPGVNRFPVTASSGYLECATSDTKSAVPLPACLRNGPPGLPSGVYAVYLFGSGDLALPEPKPVVVTVTGGTNPAMIPPSVCFCPDVSADGPTVPGPSPCHCPTNTSRTSVPSRS